MKFFTCQNGAMQILPEGSIARGGDSFITGLAQWDALAPRGAFNRPAVHELLFDFAAGNAPPKFPALLLGRAALAHRPDAGLFWCDPRGTLYPPALAAAQIPLDRLYILQPPSAQLIWTLSECLRCKGAAVVVAMLPGRLSRVEARRLQLAAEQGGAVGVLLRPAGAADIYAAATRWLVEPAPGRRNVQRWKIQLIHGHGGRIGQSVLLEKHRVIPPLVQTLCVHPSSPLAHHPPAPPPQRASA